MVVRICAWSLAAAAVSFLPQNAAKTAWPLVRVPDPVANAAIRQALDRASRLVDVADCHLLLTDFADANGRPLAERLGAVAPDLHSYLGMVFFVDDSRHARCADGVLAFTEPGSRVVHVCVSRIKETWTADRPFTVASLIHEVLHTLGLGENPPSAKEITARVLARCGR